jgi:hypothetical protein
MPESVYFILYIFVQYSFFENFDVRKISIDLKIMNIIFVFFFLGKIEIRTLLSLK